MRIRDLMTTDVITVGPDTSLKEAARRMLADGLSGLPVTDEGRLVGIISEADFLATEAERGARKRAGLLRLFVRENGVPSHQRTVGDVMTRDVRTISPEATHVEAARMMEANRVKRLPVLEEGAVVGLISRSDILRTFVRPDQEIVEEIRANVMRKVMWVDPERVAITCDDGNLVLAGNMETKSDVELLVELIKRLDGVASVESRLAWEIDNTKLEMTGALRPPYPNRNW
jgi:CBS domain-containing protein